MSRLAKAPIPVGDLPPLTATSCHHSAGLWEKKGGGNITIDVGIAALTSLPGWLKMTSSGML